MSGFSRRYNDPLSNNLKFHLAFSDHIYHIIIVLLKVSFLFHLGKYAIHFINGIRVRHALITLNIIFYTGTLFYIIISVHFCCNISEKHYYKKDKNMHSLLESERQLLSVFLSVSIMIASFHTCL